MKHLNFLLAAVLAGLCGTNVAHAQSGRTTSFAYDAVGQVTSITTPGGRVRGLQWDALGRNVQQSFGGASVGYGYNLQSAVTAVQDPRSLVTSYDRNGFGEARSQASPDTGTSSFTYDAAGNLTSRVNAAGQVENNTFDAANRIVTRTLTHPSSGSISYSFSYGTSGTEAGRLVQVSAPGMVLSYSHNLFGQVTTAAQALAGTATLTTGYGYANNGAPASITYPSGRVVTYTLDAASRIAGITVDGSQVLSGVTYSALGATTGWSFAGGQAVTRNYDSSARATSVTMPWGARQYAYDVDDRIVGISDSLLGSGTYGYDNQDRLTSASNGAGTWSYQYDANGNRTGGSSNGSSYGTSIAGGSNRMLAAGQWQNTFTADGQTVQVANGGVPACGPSLTLGYQADGQLVMSNALSAKHAPTGLRLQKTAAACVGGATTNFVYDTAGHLIGEYDATGAVIQETVWLGNLPVAVFKPGSASPYYVYPDNLGTPRGITNSGGLLVWSWDGEPFGASPPVSGPGPQGAPFKYGLRFPGQYFDEETGYHHNGWREYIPELGRYAQSDPIGLAGGMNTYAYVGGNPLSLKDPTGLVVEIEAANAETYTAVYQAYMTVRGTKRGREMCEALERSPARYVIRPTNKVGRFCPMGREDCSKTENTLMFDPYRDLMLPTASGLTPTPPAVVLAHEMGHAMGLYDDGPQGMNNVNAYENPIRRELNLPARTAYGIGDQTPIWAPTVSSGIQVSTPPKK